MPELPLMTPEPSDPMSHGGWGYARATPQEELTMADPVPAGSDVSAGTYRCTECGYELEVGSTQHLPPLSELLERQLADGVGRRQRGRPLPRALTQASAERDWRSVARIG